MKIQNTERFTLNRAPWHRPSEAGSPLGNHFAPRRAPEAAAEHLQRRSPLLVIVAYEAEPHLGELVGRLAALPEVRDSWSILLLDDSSKDRTTPHAEELFSRYRFRRWMVIRNDVNQGYGGNQKVGYRYALKSGQYTHVALLHGDCQYPPEALPEMLDQALETEADVVIASRMWSVASAWRGGMPAYKIIGNVALTQLQNLLTGHRLTEYHSGMRLYSTRLLESIPFELNSDGFDFDTEILLQAFYVDAKLTEVAIPTRYAGEVCRVPGFRYACNVVRATLDYWFQKHGIGCSLRFRDLKTRRATYLDKTGMTGSTHQLAVRYLLQSKPSSVLDIGCGQAYIGSRVKPRLPGTVYCGCDLGSEPPESCDKYWQCDLSRELPPTDPFGYDVVLCLDVLEHLREPEQFLLRLRQSHSTQSHTRFVFSTVNVAFISIRLGLLLGRFSYGDRGILDIDHCRLMTRASFVRVVREAGFIVEQVLYAPVPFQLVFGKRWWTRVATRLWRLLVAPLPGVFAFQIVIVARSKPPIPEITSSFRETLTAEVSNTESEPGVVLGA